MKFRLAVSQPSGFVLISQGRRWHLHHGVFQHHLWSGDFGTSDISTFSGEWKVYDADTVVFEIAGDALAFTTNLPSTKTVATGSALNMSVAVTGGTAPYTYVWKKMAQQ
jgi:hypothetical protein